MKGIFTKEQHDMLGQIGDDLIDFKKVFKGKPLMGAAAESVDGLFFKGITIGIDDYGLEKLPERLLMQQWQVIWQAFQHFPETH